MPAPDYTDRYNTALTLKQESEFQKWAGSLGKTKDLFDYDLRGAWIDGAAKTEGHLPDTYKKPNHPTFSNESKYSSEGMPGGEWAKEGQSWTFKASRLNRQLHGDDELQKYFEQVEPGNTLILPQ